MPSSSPKDSQDKRKILKDLAGAGISGAVADRTIGRAYIPTARKVMKTLEDLQVPAKPGRVREIKRRYAPPGVTFKEISGGAPYYETAGKTLGYVPGKTGLEEIAHELGHAQIHNKYRAYPVYGEITRGLNKAAPFMLGAGMYGYFRNKEDRPELARANRNITLGLAGAGAIGTLADEAAASRRALGMLKEMREITPRHKKVLKESLKTYKAHTGIPLAAAGAIYGASALKDRLQRRGREGNA